MGLPEEKPEPQTPDLADRSPDADNPGEPSAASTEDQKVVDETRLSSMQIALDVQAKELLHKADRVEFNIIRQRHPDWRPDLRGEDLRAEDLSGINLSGAKLQVANFESAILFGANFQNAELGEGTSFKSCNLMFADFTGTTCDNTDKSIFQGAQTEHAKPNPNLLDSIRALSGFKEDFDKDPALKSKISWEEVQSRLLHNECHYLFLARAMENGGELFGVDANGNPLISDRGDEPIMKGMNYKDTHDRVKWKHSSNDKKGTKILDAKKKPIATGYEMFPYDGNYDWSNEMYQYVYHTRKSFTRSLDKKTQPSSWLESGDDPPWPRHISYDSDRYPFLYHALPSYVSESRGVRRLLRVKKIKTSNGKS